MAESASAERSPERSDTLRIARDVLSTERAGLAVLEPILESAEFLRAVDLLAQCRGRVVVSGVGKAGLVAQRIAASFRSTATPSVFLHPTDALHGDLGLVGPEDVALFLSKSGESDELNQLVPIFRRVPMPIVAVVSRGDSQLAQAADVKIVFGPIEEAGPLKLIPTTSGTVFQVFGDILVTCLYARRGMTEEELAFLHPGGLIGSHATRCVRDLMHHGDALPRIPAGSSLRDGVMEIIAKKLGMTTVIDHEGCLLGVLTDGDIRRIVHRFEKIDGLVVDAVMTHSPRTITEDERIAAAVERMENNPGGPITSLVVVGPENCVVGVLHLHDCLRPNRTR